MLLQFELRPPELCRLTKLAGRLMLGFNALSDGAAAVLHGEESLLQDVSLGWPAKTVPGPDVHLLTLFDDLTSVMAIQVRQQPMPEMLGGGTALEILTRYEALVAASDDELEDPPEEILLAGDHLVARTVYLPGDTRLLVLDRDGRVELACEGREVVLPRPEFLEVVRGAAGTFFDAMRARTDLVLPLASRDGYMPPEELRRQGAQWQRRIEALLKRATGEKFVPLNWPW